MSLSVVCICHTGQCSRQLTFACQPSKTFLSVALKIYLIRDETYGCVYNPDPPYGIYKVKPIVTASDLSKVYYALVYH